MGSSDSTPRFHVVLHEPEIPNNTGNIGRTCLAMGAALHLIEPLGFDLDEKALAKGGAGLLASLEPSRVSGLGRVLGGLSRCAAVVLHVSAGAAPFEAAFEPGDHLVFGKETAGLPAEILAGQEAWGVGIPLRVGERSLNLSTAVALGLGEGVRQLVADGRQGLVDGLHLPA